ncbi:hypothetical protein DM01DRAFT_1190375 [Hesseltinella vesiculosa]|uniref:Tyrosine-protein kinase ephrin type A/B receptor-like domain-containing protein n=1 Tax=Hesseltinella vesiculosa TaxID=101127 RepID=A0A1X2GRH5_9FUNG|nr:hypothetical protein DM01DRAFT_1190375 [Hesseltinella vesiculosa]
MHTQLSSPIVNHICAPGSFYNQLASDYFCMDSSQQRTRLAIQCLPCPSNTYSDQFDQHQCIPCGYGTYAVPGSSSCLPCVEGSGNTHCHAYELDQNETRRKTMVAILVPVCIFLTMAVCGLLVWRVRKYLLRRQRLRDENWLLTFDELINEKISHIDCEEDTSDLKSELPLTGKYDPDETTLDGHEEKTRSALALAPLSEGNIADTTETSQHAANVESDNKSLDLGADSNLLVITSPDLHSVQLMEAPIWKRSLDVHLSQPMVPITKPTRKSNQQRVTIQDMRERSDLVHTKCYRHNLPVFVKQLGNRRIRIDEVIRAEAALMKETRHQNLVEFVGLIVEPQRVFIVEGNTKKTTKVKRNPLPPFFFN